MECCYALGGRSISLRPGSGRLTDLVLVRLPGFEPWLIIHQLCALEEDT